MLCAVEFEFDVVYFENPGAMPRRKRSMEHRCLAKADGSQGYLLLAMLRRPRKAAKKEPPKSPSLLLQLLAENPPPPAPPISHAQIQANKQKYVRLGDIIERYNKKAKAAKIAHEVARGSEAAREAEGFAKELAANPSISPEQRSVVSARFREATDVAAVDAHDIMKATQSYKAAKQILVCARAKRALLQLR